MMTLTDARARLAEVVDHARVDHEPVYLTRRNRPVAAVIAAERLAELLSAEAELAGIAPLPNLPAPTEAERLRDFELLAARASRQIEPGTPPLTDADAFYQQRASQQ